jgi:hypothetical protein
MVLVEVDMTYIYSLKVICNVQVWYRQNCIDDLPNDSSIWSREFRKWLAVQGCEIEHDEDEFCRSLRNGLGISLGYDRLKFEQDADATAFLLRWS